MSSFLDEKGILTIQRQLDGLPRDTGEDTPGVSILRYATTSDVSIFGISLLCAICAGILNPLIAVIFGRLVGIFDDYISDTVTEQHFRAQIANYSLYYVYLAIALFGLTYISTVGFYYSGERIVRTTRNAYLKAILRQNMAYFDSHGPGDVTVRIMTDMNLIQEGITSKVSVAVTAFSTFAAAFVIVFIMNWRTALVLSPTFVVMVLAFTLGGSSVVKKHKEATRMIGEASGLAEEAIASIRHVSAFGTQEHFASVYEKMLAQASELDIQSRSTVACMVAWSNAVPSLVYALAFWTGSMFLVRGWINVSELTTAAMVVTIGAFAIVRVGPAAQALTSTVSSAGMVLEDISRRSPQDPFSLEGERLPTIQGHVGLNGVSLVYPSRPSQLVLNNVSVSCPAMKTTAIVGSSGSGKSSIVSLLQRFYEPTGGYISLDGRDIQSLNLGWLRSQIALVGQSPVLFDTTIFENIRYGQVVHQSPTAPFSEQASKHDVLAAAKEANAHDFILSLPDGYETRVGPKGLQLSGGQRQRIAIARALIRKPTILLLDEATSALDSKSETAVQIALDSAVRHRTTIIVAHRLSTVRNADKIIVMSEGQIVETGNHNELILRDGHYAKLVSAQQITESTSIGLPAIKAQDQPHDKSSPDLPEIGLELDMISDGRVTPAQMKQASPTSESSLLGTLAFIVKLSKDDCTLVLGGLFLSVIAGLGIPGQSVLFAKVLETLGLPSIQYDFVRDRINLYSGLFVLLAGVAFLSWLGLGILFAYSTQRLSSRLKSLTFRSIISQDVAFFDETEHKTGSLVAILASSSEDVVSLGGPVMGGTLCFISTILGGIILSIAVGWKLALVCTATTPVIVACGWVRLQVLSIFDSKTRQNGQDAATYASELVQNVSTVASFGLEELVLERYDHFLERQSENSLRSILVASSLYAASQSVVYLCAALAFWYGGTLVGHHEYSLFTFFICFSALISGSQIAGSIFTFAPDASKAMHASSELKAILARKPRAHTGRHDADVDRNKSKLDCHEGLGSVRDTETVEGSLEFSNVSFCYPSRPGRAALDGLSLKVEPGQHIALVGPSGCGKSTVFSLIERFYDADSGTVLINGTEITKLDLAVHRSRISLVSQDAILYTGTIRENIGLGSPGKSFSDEEIMDVCKQANIHDFILSLQDGLSTMIGPSGCTLSGGQKQRISIARALLRHPEILLLDEATSALDTESEALVQAALIEASQGKTTISIAHRLSTVQQADCICVLERGRIVETGSHKELMSLGGRYWDYVCAQNLR